jgi:enterochelin esterase-like enzyme
MKNPSITRLALFVLLGAVCCGLPAAEKKNSTRKRQPPVVSPTVHPDRTVTFRVQAKGAKEVSVSGQMISGKAAMTEGTNDIWSVTLDPVAPGIYEYSLTVDGFKMVDPGNMRLKPMRSPRTSMLHIPGDHAYDFTAVPHGTVHYHAHHSRPIDRFREFQVYTPPGYETGGESYPVLVLQHGHSDCFATWTTHGKAHWILDNLIAAGKARPMIVVMLDGHPIPGSYGDGRSRANTEELRRDLLDAVMPMVERLYRVKPGRENRAITGLSMGGLHSLTIGLNELDEFAWVGAFSAAIPKDGEVDAALAKPKRINDQLNLLWISIGKEDFLLQENEEFVARLQAGGVRHQWRVTEGGHSWPVWRDYLAEFVPLVFR